MKYHTYLLFGPPGSGKGTQGRTLGSIPRFFHCACGDVFARSTPARRSGALFSSTRAKGSSSPTRSRWNFGKRRSMPRSRSRFQARHRYSGARRHSAKCRPGQDHGRLDRREESFSSFLPESRRAFRRLKKRALKDNRLDDANEEVIKRRLALYETESKPVLGYYGPDRITCIDATEPPAKVLLHILESVNGVNGSHEPAAV